MDIRHTDRQTNRHVDSMTDPAQRAESVKMGVYNVYNTVERLSLSTYLHIYISTRYIQCILYICGLKTN